MAENLYLLNCKVCVMNFCASSKKFMYLVQIIYMQWRSQVVICMSCYLGFHALNLTQLAGESTLFFWLPTFLAFLPLFWPFLATFHLEQPAESFLSESWWSNTCKHCAGRLSIAVQPRPVTGPSRRHMTLRWVSVVDRPVQLGLNPWSSHSHGSCK